MTVTKRYKLPLFHVKKANFNDEQLPITSFITCMHVVCSIGQAYLLYNLSSEVNGTSVTCMSRSIYLTVY